MSKVADSDTALLLAALQQVVGAAIVLDRRLRIVAVSVAAQTLLGTPIPLGQLAPKILCGDGPERPIAEALAKGKPVSAELVRSAGKFGTRTVHVRATPLHAPIARRRQCIGWLLLLDTDPFPLTGPDARVDTWGILTRDPAMKLLLRQVDKVARSSASVLIRGETGSGKELIAHAIHQVSARASGPFRAINCAALPPNLLESELFGHARGAFTGAVRDAPGHFRLAHRGTLFLDEVAELPLGVQAKLLRVVQERTVIPVGATSPVEVDVRIVAATHGSLREAVSRGLFRADLMYRLRVIPIYLPPLRERVRDIELLAWHFISELAKGDVRLVQRITPEALRHLESYPWPGNVRELRNVLEYALVMGSGVVLSEADLPNEVREGEREPHRVVASEEPLPAEARRLMTALERAGGHHGRAAQALGMSRVTFWRHLKKFGIGNTNQV